MADPTATALLSGAHITEFAESDLPKVIALTGAGTPGDGASIAVWEWSLLPRDADNAGGLPAASLLDTTSVGDFVNGKSSVQNPGITLDKVGGYNFSLRVQNNLGDWSDPSFLGDNEQCQAIVYILTNGGLRLPPANMFHYEDDAVATIKSLEPGNLDLVQPTGVVAAIEGLWVFDAGGSALDDRTANGHDLILQAGGERYSVINRRVGLTADGTNRYATGTARPGLQTFGAITIEVLVTPSFVVGTSQETWLTYNGTVASEAQNALYTMMSLGSDEHAKPWSSVHENGVGVNNFGGSNGGFGITGSTQLVTLTRAANGTDFNWYFDGINTWGGAYSNAPTGGAHADSRFHILSDAGSTIAAGVLHAVRITKEEYTAAQVLAAARRVLGPVGLPMAGFPE